MKVDLTFFADIPPSRRFSKPVNPMSARIPSVCRTAIPICGDSLNQAEFSPILVGVSSELQINLILVYNLGSFELLSEEAFGVNGVS